MSAIVTFCGPCPHPMHWHECGADADLTAGPCRCRNDEATIIPDREPQTGETALREALATTMRVMLGGRPGVTVGPRDPDVDRAWTDVLAGALRDLGFTITPLATAQEPDTTEYERGRADALRDVGNALLAAPDDTRPASVAGLRCSAVWNGCRCGRKPHKDHDDRHVWMNTLDDGAAVDPAQYPALAQRLREHSDPDAAGEALPG